MKYFFIVSIFLIFLLPTISFGVTYVETLYIYNDGSPHNPNNPDNIYCSGSVTLTAPYEVTRGSQFVMSNKANGGLCPDRPVDFDRIESSLNIFPSLDVVWKRYTPDQTSYLQGTFTAPLVGDFNFDAEVMMNTFYSPIKSATGFFNYRVLVNYFECSDNQPNDNDGLNDTFDPQCHTDCNPNNQGSYISTHNSETNPPNGSCSAIPTLQLNGRAAFFEVAKKFFVSITTKAFARE